MKIFIDTEFTDLNAGDNIKLISAGFVAENGEEFYFELIDNFVKADCSNFVIDEVLPHLDNRKHGMKVSEAMLKLKAWCENFGERVRFLSDAPYYDFSLIAELLYYENLIIENLEVLAVQVNIDFVISDADGSIADRIEKYFEYQPMAIRHHALWDARALASVCISPDIQLKQFDDWDALINSLDKFSNDFMSSRVQPTH